MRRFRFLSTAAATMAAVTLPALAAEGRIPIPFTNPVTTPVSIATGGRYILTRNMTPTGAGPLIDIVVPGDVDLDLNGFTLDQAGGANPVIRISAGGPGGVVIRNGNLRNGSVGVESPVGGRIVIIENVKINDMILQGVHLTSAENYAIRDCVIENAPTGILVDGAANHHGIIERNLIRRTADGIVEMNPRAVQILHNTLQELTGGTTLSGIYLQDGFGNLVAENTIDQLGSAAFPTVGIRLRKTVTSKLFDNLVSRTSLHGIHLDVNAHDNLVWKNVVREAGAAGGHGIFIESDRNHVEGNVANTNAGKGLVFLPGADNNVYRGNTARGNNTAAVACAGACGPGTDFCNAGAGNSSNGDNWLPVAPCL